MTAVAERAPTLLRLWQGPNVEAVVARRVGEDPVRVELERVHFPGRRPIQPSLRATLRSGRTATVLGEYCPDDPHGQARDVLVSLSKSRKGQKAGLTAHAVELAAETGLVLRRSCLDERLPGLRLLHDPALARATVPVATCRTPRRCHGRSRGPPARQAGRAAGGA